eukprot:9345492-Pyramimonas_sp.AAC.1
MGSQGWVSCERCREVEPHTGRNPGSESALVTLGTLPGLQTPGRISCRRAGDFSRTTAWGVDLHGP